MLAHDFGMAADEDGTPLADWSDGISLQNAVERFSDPEKWRAYAAAAPAAAGRRRHLPIFVGNEPIAGWDVVRQVQANNRLIDASERAERAVCGDFLSRLRSGELIASGFKVPVDPGLGRQAIPADLWTVLRPNFQDSSARGGGCEFVGVLVSRPGATAIAKSPGKAAAAEQRPLSFPGRPSVMRAIEQEMRRRAEQGELQEQLREECRHLAVWAKSEFDRQQTPKARSIENALRVVYSELRAGKSGIK